MVHIPPNFSITALAYGKVGIELYSLLSENISSGDRVFKEFKFKKYHRDQ